MNLIFYTNPNKPGTVDMLGRLVDTAAGLSVHALPTKDPDELDRAVEENAKDTFAVVTLGGDGTILRGVAAASRFSLPVLGVNMGRVGFFSEIGADGFKDALKRLIDGDYALEKASMLSCTVNGEPVGHCLNDFAVHRQELPSITHISLSIDGDDVGDVMADGLIVGTPSGSTAYSLSAGGPVVAPKLDCILVTPICPHSLTVRPIAASSDSVIRVKLKCTGRLLKDGQNIRTVSPGDELVLSRSELTARFIRFERRNVFRLIREKLI